MSDDTVKFFVDGKEVEGSKGEMVMEVTDRLGVYIPRFCYHKKLSIAANCRMCLVEVERAPKPLPACATPIGEGMKVFTRSAKAISAQKATMEFLLINHPLDCPICDQGGECELQDLAMGYGRDVSRYNDGKRVVKDRNIGPLVSTDMTRCIHCTRCVRFGEEIQGIPELGTVGRGENMKISTYVEKAVDHELSGNIIDLCPVGALNNKPYRYSARSWEMLQHATVSPHDCAGSNMYAHTLRGTIKRIVPKENESINETWISDRDRFSYEGVYADDRLRTPRVREGKSWRELSWEDALEQAAEVLGDAEALNIGMLASPFVTLEEAHLLRRLADHLGTPNVDHRIARRDFSDQASDPAFPWLGCEIGDIDRQNAIFVIGSNLRREVPILAHRLRKAARNGADISFANREKHEYFFDVLAHLSGAGLVELLAGVAVAAAGDKLPGRVAALCDGVEPNDEQQAIAQSLADAGEGLVLLGNIAGRHAASSAVRALAAAIADATGARLGFLSEGPNSAGACLAGLLPHREPAGRSRTEPGKHAADMLTSSLDALVLVNLEPDRDIHAVDGAVDRLSENTRVIALTPYASASLLECADLLLPIGTFAETSGSYVNVAGTVQSFAGVANPVGEARPAWKVLRVLGNLLDVPDFDYVSSEQVREAAELAIGTIAADNTIRGSSPLARPSAEDAQAADIDVPMYAVDAVVRRATALQLTPEARRSAGQPEAAERKAS